MESKRPYQPSWADRLFQRIEQLPIPVGAFYLLVYALAALAMHIAYWLNGAPWGSISIVQLYTAIWFPANFFVIHNTDRLAAQAVAEFAPAVRGQSRALEDIRYRLTHMPARVAAVLTLLAIAVLLVSAVNDPSLLFMETSLSNIHPVSWAIVGFFGIASYSLAPLMIYHAARQLILVNQAYKLVGKVNVFHQQPLYSFSGLTMRTAFFFFLMVYVTYLGELLYQASAVESAINLTLSAVILPLSVLIVLLPLLGIHHKIAQAKTAALEDSGAKIEHLQETIYRAVAKNKYTQTKEMDAALNSLFKVNDRLKALPTWPWDPGAFRNFLSAVLLPLALWVVQQVLSRLFGS